MDLTEHIRLARFLACDQTDVASQVTLRRNVEELVAEASDGDLLRAYQCTDGEPGDLEADALLAEIERRGLDV